MSDVPQRLVRRLRDLKDEAWLDPQRGTAVWRTLFSKDVTGTSSLSSGVCELVVGARLAPHRHAAVETYYVLQGEGILTLGAQEHEVTAGTSVLIPSLLVHGLVNVGASTLRFHYVFATDAFSDVQYDFDVESPPPAGTS